MTYWEFTARRHHWNERHKDPDASPIDDEPVEPPSVEFVRERQRELREMGYG